MILGWHKTATNYFAIFWKANARNFARIFFTLPRVHFGCLGHDRLAIKNWYLYEVNFTLRFCVITMHCDACSAVRCRIVTETLE